MKLSKTLIYAVACINELGKHPGDYESVKEIAMSQSIPTAYCQKVLCILSRLGFVESVKGRGICLIRSPETIKALDLIQALEKPTKPLDLLPEENHIFEKEMSRRISMALFNTTIKDLTASAKTEVECYEQNNKKNNNGIH